MIRLLPLVLLGCASYPLAWTVKGPAPAGWEAVMDATRGLASCDLRGKWGGTIVVHPAPFVDAWGVKVWGSNPSNTTIEIVYAPRAVDTALAEEACHAWLSICERNYLEPPAKACRARVLSLIAG